MRAARVTRRRDANATAAMAACYIRAMRPASFFFGFFWFSHRMAAGEASA
jgi:hypothetical protein